jgi:hypothetical protein
MDNTEVSSFWNLQSKFQKELNSSYKIAKQFYKGCQLLSDKFGVNCMSNLLQTYLDKTEVSSI